MLTTVSTSLCEAHDNLEQTAAANEDEELSSYERELTSYLRESCLPRSTDIYAFDTAANMHG